MKVEIITTHENARAGFKNLFTAEVLFIIATVVVVVLIAFIMQLVGLSKAGKDEPIVKSAFVASIVALIASAVIPFIGTATDATWLYSLGDIIATVISLYVVHQVLFGGANLNPTLTDKAQGTWRFYLTSIIPSQYRKLLYKVLLSLQIDS